MKTNFSFSKIRIQPNCMYVISGFYVFEYMRFIYELNYKPQHL